MKILAINCKPDLSYFTTRGLNLEVEYATINQIFPVKFLYNVKDQYGVEVPMYTPDCASYLETHYKTFDYSFIMVGWNPTDYSNVLSHTGGFTCPEKLSSGTTWITVREDPGFVNNNYPIHELHHGLCGIINIDYGIHIPIDFMDNTLVNGTWIPYYKNDFPNDPDSNYAVTWKNIIPYLLRLNAITYMNNTTQTPIQTVNPTVTLTRVHDWGNETVGMLETGSFTCNTLELPWKDNQSNISCIPKGTYNCKWRWTLKFGWCYGVENVPNRSGILFHEGNYFFNTLGCIILGDKYGDLNNDKTPDLLNSKDTRKKFEVLMNKKDFTLIIR